VQTSTDNRATPQHQKLPQQMAPRDDNPAEAKNPNEQPVPETSPQGACEDESLSSQETSMPAEQQNKTHLMDTRQDQDNTDDTTLRCEGLARSSSPDGHLFPDIYSPPVRTEAR
jgi:hypothetical protein